MPVNVEKNNGVCRVRFDGAMNIYNAVELKKSLAENIAGCSGLEIDLSGVSEMDTSGLQLLIMLNKEAAKSNNEFRISAGSKAVRNLLELFNMERFFGIY